MDARARGGPWIDLTGTNPVHAGLGPPVERIRAALDDPGVGSYEPDPAGLPSARRAVADAYAARGVAVDPDRIVLTASTSEAYGFLFKLLCDPGDEVLVPAPSYPLFEPLAHLEGVRVRTYPLRYDGAWHVDVDAFRRAAAGRVRAAIVVHPNNPTGSFLRRDEARAIDAACAGAGIAVIADEVFAEYPLRDDPERAGSFAAGGAATTFALGGLSKSVALPQLKLAWVVVVGPAAAGRAALDGLEWIADAYLSVGAAVQCAVSRLLALGPEVRARILDRVRRNLDAIHRRTHGSPVAALDVEGGWSAVLRVPSVRTAEDWAVRLVETRGVLVQPGYFYDFDDEAHLIVSLLGDPDGFDAGVDAVVACVRETTGD